MQKRLNAVQKEKKVLTLIAAAHTTQSFTPLSLNCPYWWEVSGPPINVHFFDLFEKDEVSNKFRLFPAWTETY